MKKILFIIFLLCFSVVGFGQSTLPRFGVLKSQDNTGRVLNYRYATLTDATGADTITITPQAYQTIIKATTKDSLTIKSVNTLSCLGDQLTIVTTSPHKHNSTLKFTGTGFANAITITTDSLISVVNKYVFDGVKWVK